MSDAIDRRRVPARGSTRPRPSRPTSSRSSDRYGLFIGGEFVEPKSGQVVRDDQPGHRGAARRGRRGRARGRRRSPSSAAREASKDGWRELPGRERAKYLYRIARQLQERAREFAVLETMNGGKPIKESRDVDLPLAAAHFFYYAGWADKLEYAFPGPARPSRSAWRARSSRGTSRC